ncbi:MAG: ABC transporter ATP-binding protein [Flavobacteriales bacterium]|nr:ABC transporter ATP-binding protein [Flavobacteriales bacterium]|tara:strand:- start:49547 stop:50167 length:621 start_codon:yes stop_codon:yes gene_type:complete
MKIKLNNIGKRFNREWIFRKVDFQLESNKVYGVIGPNGSGKSSLLKLISQAEIPSEGKIEFSLNEKEISSESAYNYLSIAAPYTDVAEQLTLGEFLNFHLNFSPLKNGLSKSEFLQTIYLEDSINKQISFFSSGMKQRLKLGLALLSQKPLVILDEPSSNLDEKGIELYQQMLKENSRERIILIGSNEEQKELQIADQKINITNYK